MVFTENEYFALHKCIAIVVYISKYVVLFLMADFIRQPWTKALERIKCSNNIPSNVVAKICNAFRGCELALKATVEITEHFIQLLCFGCSRAFVKK